MTPDERKAQDILEIEEAVYALYRSCENDIAVRMAAIALRKRGELSGFRCDVGESAGMAEVIELNGYSKRVPCA